MNRLKKLNKVVVIILLLIPGINWIVEIVLRLLDMIEKPDLQHILMFVLVLIGFGNIIGWIDLILYLVNGNFLLAD